MQSEQARILIETLDRQARRHTTEAAAQCPMVWRSWGSGPPLVMVHGGAGTWLHWVRNIEGLARERTLWLPDLPGFGDSALPREGLDADSIAPMVLDGARTLLQGEPFDLMGFSFGSLVAGCMTQQAPQLVRQLILVGATGMNLNIAPRHELRSLRGVTDPQEREAVLRHNLCCIMFHDPGHVDALAIAVQDLSAPRERVRGRKLAQSDIMLRLAPQWQCAVDAIWGADEGARHRDPTAFDAATARLGLRQRNIIQDAGHWVQFEQPAAFNALVLKYLQFGPLPRS